MKIGTLTTGAAVQTTINLTYVPQYLCYVAATQLTGIKVTVLGDGVITDLDQAGLNSLSSVRMPGRKTNMTMLPIADGIITGKNVEIIFTNSAAQTPDIQAINLQKGSRYITNLRQLVLQNSGTVFSKFQFLGLANAAATDLITVEFFDGLVQKFDVAELSEYLGFFQNDVNNAYNQGLDNWQGRINKVTYIPAVGNVVVHQVKVISAGNVA